MTEIIVGVLVESWHILNAAAPFVLFGFLAAGLMKVFIPDELMTAHLGANSFFSVVKASLIGVPIPLCSCGVLPAAVGLKRQGADKGAVTAFMISTPETGVDSIAVTWALIDPLMTLIRPVAAFLTATVAGILINLFPEKGGAMVPFENLSAPSCGCEGCGCSSDAKPVIGMRERVKIVLDYAFGEMVKDIGGWMVAGVMIAGIISYFVPSDFIRHYTGGEFTSLLLMLVIGIPLYVCASASTPIAASLLLKGLSPGAALVFLLAGPATNGATITVLLKVIGKRATSIYLVAIAICSLALGWLTNRIYTYFNIDIIAAVSKAEHLEHKAFGVVCSVIFLLLVARSFVVAKRTNES